MMTILGLYAMVPEVNMIYVDKVLSKTMLLFVVILNVVVFSAAVGLLV